jgi:Flp pilus assembly protein TadD
MTRPLTLVAAAVLALLGAALPALAAGTSDGSSSSSSSAPSFAVAKATVNSGNYAAALPMLVAITKDDPRNADAWNLLGFSYRQLDQLQASDAAYLKVLTINPDHLGALEYQGELFITQGKIDAAKANLARLQGLCGSCEEAEDLQEALKAAGA